MKKTKFPAKINDKVEKINPVEVIPDNPTPSEMMEENTQNEKLRLLKIQTEIQTRLINIKIDAFHIGKLLNEAKETLPHGQFTPWIEMTFEKELPYSTAYFYMRVYDVFKDDPTAVQYIPTTYL